MPVSNTSMSKCLNYSELTCPTLQPTIEHMNSSSTHYFKVNFNQAVENYREISLDSLNCDYKPKLMSLKELKGYANDLGVFASKLMKLVEGQSTVRFDNLRRMCRDGWTAILMPDVVFEMEGLSEEDEVYVLVLDQDGEVMGTLVNTDLNF